MEKFSVVSTQKTPQIEFDPETGIFSIRGTSYPENAMSHYEEAIAWLERYALNPMPSTKLTFEMEYFNSSSAASIFRIIEILRDLRESKDVAVEIYWYYEADDRDMFDAGESFNNLLDDSDFRIKIIQN